MSYEVKYTDYTNKGAIIVEDKTVNTDTSLNLPGKSSTAYGQSFAENFLHLLENFANDSAPTNPVEGQLWYDTSTGVSQLKVYDGTTWAPSGGLKKSPTAPSVTNSLDGDVWVDTKNQQLYLFNGTSWILVGPEFAGGLLTGVKALTVLDITDVSRTILVSYIDDVPVMIISVVSFTPKRRITGFSVINKGVNISSTLKYYGVSETAENLLINNVSIPSSNFLRSDIASTTNAQFNVRSNSGVNIGSESQLSVAINNQTTEIKQNVSGSSIDFILRNNTAFNNVLHIDSDKKVGINNQSPEEELDVKGNIKLSSLDGSSSSGNLYITSTTNSTGLGTGSVYTLGGASISQDLYVGGDTEFHGDLITSNIYPYVPVDEINITGRGNIGSTSNKFNQIYANTVNANLSGNVNGDVFGTADDAKKLRNSISLSFTGDVSGTSIAFDGSQSVPSISLTVSNDFIANKSSITSVAGADEILVNKVDTSDGSELGAYRVSKANFLKSIPTIPVGTIMPYGGVDAPSGWLICDGREILKSDYNLLWQTIRYNFKPQQDLTDNGVNSFALPDMRGRFPLGLVNMGTQGTASTVANSEAFRIGGKSGSENKTILEENLPEHEHDMQGVEGSQYYAVRVGSEETLATDAIGLPYEPGATATQAISSSGGIKTTSTLGQALDVMNPFLSLTFIIYTGQ